MFHVAVPVEQNGMEGAQYCSAVAQLAAADLPLGSTLDRTAGPAESGLPDARATPNLKLMRGVQLI